MIRRLDGIFGHRVAAPQRTVGLVGLDPDGWAAQTLAGFVGSVALSPLMLLPVLVYAYDVKLGFGPDTAGRISSAALLGLAMATVLVSLRTKHWSMGRVSVVGMALMLFFSAMSLVLQDLTSFFLLTFLAGFGGGLAQAAVSAALARTQRSERAFAIFTCFQFVYPGLGAWFLPSLLEGGWGFDVLLLCQMALIVAALGLAPVVGAFRLRAELLAADQEPHPDQMEWALLLHLPAALSTIGFMIYGASNGAIWAYSEGIGRLSGLDVTQISNIIALANVIAGVAALGVIWLGNRLGHFIPLIVGILAQLLSIWILVTFQSGAGFLLGTMIFTIAWAVVFPYFLSIQSDLDHSGTVVAFGQFTNLIGTAAGPSIAAYVLGGDGDYVSAMNISMWMTVLALVPMIAILIIRRRRLGH
ncbi:MFS transporter [Paracoccus siganidrum]|uniref:MFS transporter n=1 Tax=Paracoccus siganidrum TaxID=1276757 RepID=A0A419ABC7_9RHOB|nr:MFS transporter [Paracoccus siganidrum]RJL20766.1 MFS transporter [Paracoccus siganidrum]RMC31924.1 hypothetical protein C9E82_15365 [Paracoccus siganidrum]